MCVPKLAFLPQCGRQEQHLTPAELLFLHLLLVALTATADTAPVPQELWLPAAHITAPINGSRGTTVAPEFRQRSPAPWLLQSAVAARTTPVCAYPPHKP